MTKEITKLDQRELHALAKSINDHQEAIDCFKDRMFGVGNEAIEEFLLQAEDLLKAREMIPNGQWQDWLKAHCPMVAIRTAQHWMAIAKDPQRVALLKAGTPLRRLFGPGEADDKSTTPKVLPEYLRSLDLCSRWTKYVLRHPIDNFPEETKSEMRKELEPVAAGLWPEKFAV